MTRRGGSRNPEECLSRGARVDVRLLSGFEVIVDGVPRELTHGAQRLVAFLAISDHALSRQFIAGNLWVECAEERAAGNLRSALWRLRREGLSILDSEGSRLALDRSVDVDLHRFCDLARTVLVGDSEIRSSLVWDFIDTGELLPGWYDDWVMMERERFTQLRLSALEALSEQMTARARFVEAVATAIAAVRWEPLRESSHRVLIEAYLADGNPGQALRAFHRYRRLLRDELDVEPSDRLLGLLQAMAPLLNEYPNKLHRDATVMGW
jgi:DNA-binding SARP family transcriptional activator